MDTRAIPFMILTLVGIIGIIYGLTHRRPSHR